jgi:hypothetical protein
MVSVNCIHLPHIASIFGLLGFDYENFGPTKRGKYPDKFTVHSTYNKKKKG